MGTPNGVWASHWHPMGISWGVPQASRGTSRGYLMGHPMGYLDTSLAADGHPMGYSGFRLNPPLLDACGQKCMCV